MKDMNDEEMQEMAENSLSGSGTGMSSSEEKDIHNYLLLFEALGKEPPLPLPYHFAAKITAAIQAEKNRAADIRLWILVGLCFLVAILIGFYYLSTINSINGSQLVISFIKYKWVLVFAAAVFLIIQFLDNKLIGNTVDR